MPAPTLTLAVGTNTYLTLTDAEAYMLRRYDPSGAWAAADDGTKNTLLANATLDIDRQMWLGAKTDPGQALEFPRNGEGVADASYTLVQRACVEQALWMLTAKPGTRQVLQAQGVRSVRIGDVTETYHGGRGSDLAPAARDLLTQWWIGTAAIA